MPHLMSEVPSVFRFSSYSLSIDEMNDLKCMYNVDCPWVLMCLVKNLDEWLFWFQLKFEEGVIGTPQLTDSLVIPEDVEFLGQKIDLAPFKGLLTSVQDTASSVAKSISSQPPFKFSISSSNAESWLLTTYLDQELRISRGDNGSVFVLIKEGSSLLTP